MDDRKKFLKSSIKNSILLGKNKKILKKSCELFNNVDKYNYCYLWTWLGIPIIQMPADIMVTQEIIFQSKPDVIIETGVARGGSLIFYASMLHLIKKKFSVVGIDVNIKPHNKKAVLNNKLSENIYLIEGSSTDKKVLKKVEKLVRNRKTLVILDSDHSKEHVLNECNQYSRFVKKNGYLVVADTLLGRLNPKQTPKKRSQILFKGNEPLAAVNEFLKNNRRFKKDKSLDGKLIFSSSHGGYLKKIK